jgi:lipoprotein NlpI
MNAETLVADGIEKYLAGNTDGARCDFDAALCVEPYEPNALFQLGVLNRHTGRSKDALTGFDALLALQPMRLDAMMQRAGVLGELGSQDEALAALGTAIDFVVDGKRSCAA